jgi:hypothetical protein
MKRYLTLTAAFGLVLVLSGKAVAGGPRGAASPARVGGLIVGDARPNNIQRHWRAPVYVTPPHIFHHPGYPVYSPHYYHYGVDPRSVVIITPYTYYPYYAPVTVVTSEPFYCHVHHVGFISRAGFLDHISGTHKIPLETAASICTDSNDSCVIEGY